MLIRFLSRNFFKRVTSRICCGFVIEFCNRREAIRPEFFKSWARICVEPFVVLPKSLVIERLIEETDVIMRSLVFVTVFPAIEIADFMTDRFSQPSYKFGNVTGTEGVVSWYVMSVSELFGGSFVGVSVCKSNEARALLISPQAGLVDDPDCPHECMIQATTKALTTSHFECLSSACFIECKSTRYYVLVALQRRVARHFTVDSHRA